MNKKIIAVFKTHFDYGYTSRKQTVLDSYCGEKLDKAISVCESTQKDGENMQYKWTTSAYLLMKMYESVTGEKKERMKALVERGQIVCHALPFTMHSPLMDKRLAEEMFLWTDDYVKTFKKPFPKAAKLTDCPGYSSGIIAPMVKRGVKFLHIGKNGSWAAPKVPSLFWWEDYEGNRILVMYNHYYGSTVNPPKDWKLPVWLAFCHTNDNLGVQDDGYIRDIKKTVKRGYEFQTGTLDDFVDEIYKCDLSGLPVIKGELSDPWIYGVGSYPDAVSLFRRSKAEFYRLEQKANALGVDIEKEKREFLEHALVYTEHTFGICVQTCFPIREYDKKRLANNRKTEENYRFAEQTWEDERKVAQNAAAVCAKIREKIGEAKEEREEALPFDVSVDGKYLRFPFAGREVTLYYEYRVFGTDSMNDFLRKTLVRYFFWAVSDMGKLSYPELPDSRFLANVSGVEKKGNEVIVSFETSKKSHDEYGNFARYTVTLKKTESGVTVTFDGKGKEAINLVEAGNFVIDLGGNGEKFVVEQIGNEMDVDKDIVPMANHTLWSMDSYAAIDGVGLRSFDAPLVSFEKNAICKCFYRSPKKKKAAFVVNFFNNHWGTNFPQWIEGDYSFEMKLFEKK